MQTLERPDFSPAEHARVAASEVAQLVGYAARRAAGVFVDVLTPFPAPAVGEGMSLHDWNAGKRNDLTPEVQDPRG